MPRRRKKIHRSQIITAILMIFYLIGIIVLIGLTFLIRGIDLHIILSLVGTAFIGIGIMMFRLLRGRRTRCIKYVHLIFHLLGLIILIAGFVLLQSRMEHDHMLPALLTFSAIILQFVIAVFIFAYLYEYRRLRLFFAPFHDIVGVWIFICIGYCCFYHYYFENNDDKVLLLVHIYNAVACITLLMVVLVIMCPYLDWELVGRI
ncbi:uncharacterized protein LOC119672186 [Teleopsis dalmanni]|uniref:uncharacterized protein LOC119670743 n=1 Tax=Teleopsis dalmanni TaxID=139649 RepID=UPI000D32BF4A|nr:uncharacterized protein LOC119670743 [Teleopsis dalmanni]XP_037939106.1 uncharacterized protein LOC119672186 [Teleopsis dalmanni]